MSHFFTTGLRTRVHVFEVRVLLRGVGGGRQVSCISRRDCVLVYDVDKAAKNDHELTDGWLNAASRRSDNIN